MEIIGFVISFFFGASIGSFINVVLDRYNTGLPFWKNKSFCFSCNQALRKLDMFPVISFIFLKGRCRNCGDQIPYKSFVIELLMGIFSVLLAWKTGFFASSFSFILTTNYLLLLSILGVIVLISFYDLRHMIIPDSFLITFLILSFLYNSFMFLSVEALSFKLLALSLLPNILSGFLLSLPFLILFLLSRGRWMGFGDIKYIAVLGFFLGFTLGSSAIVLAFWIGAVFSLFLIAVPKVLSFFGLYNLKNKFKMDSTIPFGPFLSLGIIISFYLNVDILKVQILKELLFGIF